MKKKGKGQVIMSKLTYDGIFSVGPQRYKFHEIADLKNVQGVQPGVYQGSISCGDIYLDVLPMKGDLIITDETSILNDVMSYVSSFFSEEVVNAYKQFGILHKAGVLLTGEPGCGKSTIIRSVVDYAVREKQAIVLMGPDLYDTHQLLVALSEITDAPKLVIYEDFERRADSPTLANLLDGAYSVENTLFLCTTNYIDEIPDRLKYRPSRFSRVYEVGKPSRTIRETYISRITPAGYQLDQAVLQELLDASEDLTLDQTKDLLLSVLVFGLSIQESADRLKKLHESSSDDEDDDDDD